MSESALSLNFFDPEHGLHGSARSGATLLFDGSGSTVVPNGPTVEARGEGWRAELDGSFELDFDPVVPAAELGGLVVRLCAVSGLAGGRKVDCLGTVAETRTAPVWGELDVLRTISALFDRDNAFLALSQRARGAVGHAEDRISAWLLQDGEPVALEDARISTVYDGDGRQRSASLELWTPDEEDFPVRATGTVVAGSSLQLEGLDVHAAVFRWRMDDREGAGAYELMARSEPEAA